MAEEAEVGGGGENVEIESKLEFTPTWIVAAVCTVIFICVSVERYLRLGKFFRKNDQKALFGALQKVQEELMTLGVHVASAHGVTREYPAHLHPQAVDRLYAPLQGGVRP